MRRHDSIIRRAKNLNFAAFQMRCSTVDVLLFEDWLCNEWLGRAVFIFKESSIFDDGCNSPYQNSTSVA